MATIHLKGRVTPGGKLVFDTPSVLPPGEVEITITFDEPGDNDETFTEDEINDLLTFTPASGADIVAAGLTGGWAHKGITDPVAWVEGQRRKQREQRVW